MVPNSVGGQYRGCAALDQMPQMLNDGSTTWRDRPPLNKPRATHVDTGQTHVTSCPTAEKPDGNL